MPQHTPQRMRLQLDDRIRPELREAPGRLGFAEAMQGRSEGSNQSRTAHRDPAE
jgi:hypothetical protein